MMKKLFMTFLICFLAFEVFAEIQPNIPTCIVPGDPKVYQTIYNVANPDLFRQENVAGEQLTAGFPCTEAGQMTWVPDVGSCRVRNASGSIYRSGTKGIFKLVECPIDDYVLPLAALVVGFSFSQLRKKLPLA